MTIHCYILEDQAPARRVLEHYIERLPGFDVVGSAAVPEIAAQAIKGAQIDLLFLDLGLPQQDGFGFLQDLANPPAVIVTTAFGERALEGFAHGVADYLVKPFSFERFCTATERAQNTLRARVDASLLDIALERGRTEYVAMRDITSLSADGDYVKIRLPDRRLYTLGPLTKWLERLPQPPFVRVHRSHVVNCQHVTGIEARAVDVGGQTLPVSGTYAGTLKRELARRV